jgi:hypothetical protein
MFPGRLYYRAFEGKRQLEQLQRNLDVLSVRAAFHSIIIADSELLAINPGASRRYPCSRDDY